MNITHDGLQWGLCSVFWALQQYLCLWCMRLSPGIAQRLVTTNNGQGYRSMGEFELSLAVAHITITAPRITLLDAACNGCDNTAVTGWTNCITTPRSDVTGDLLCASAAILHTNRVTASIVFHPEKRNLLADDAYHC